MSNTPRPPQQRVERMKVLEDEVGELQRVEEVLIAREGAERSARACFMGIDGSLRERLAYVKNGHHTPEALDADWFYRPGRPKCRPTIAWPAPACPP
jgi:hypothetical protein